MLVCTTFSVAATNVSSRDGGIKNPLTTGGNTVITEFTRPSQISRFNPVGEFYARAEGPEGYKVLIWFQFDDGSTSQSSEWQQDVAELRVRHRFRGARVGEVFTVRFNAESSKMGDNGYFKSMDVIVLLRKARLSNMAPFELLLARFPLLEYLLGM